MAAQRVKDQGEVSLNEVRYPLVKGSRVQSVLTSIYPGKVVIGDVSRDSDVRASTWAISNHQGGIGVERMRSAAEVDRAWWSTCQLFYDQHLILPPLAEQTAASGVSGVFDIGVICELPNSSGVGEIYASFDTDLRKYNNTGDAWGSSLHTLPGEATDTITMRLGNTSGTTSVFMLIAHTSGYTYTTDGSTFTDDTEDAKYLASWDDRLWAIDNTGQLRYSNVIGTWVDDAQLPLPDGSVTDLLVGRDALNRQVLYAMTTAGLYVHDIDNARFLATDVGLPTHPDNGLGSVQWRNFIFIPSGLGVYKYATSGSQAVLTVSGPDRDDGVPANRRGTIKQLVGSHNELFALTDATTTTSSDMFVSGGFSARSGGSTEANNVIIPAVGFSYILSYNEFGWQVKWLSDSSARAINFAHVSTAYNEYRLWWGWDERVYYMDLPRDIVNPKQVKDFRYATSEVHETPWFNAGQIEVKKLALSARIEVADASSSETVKVEYATNYSDSSSSDYTTLGTITSSGTTEYVFPNSTTPTGSAFRSIKFKVTLSRGTSPTKSPDVLAITLRYRKKLEPKWGHSMELDITNRFGNRSPAQLRAALVTATEQDELAEFTFRDDDGNDRNYYVDIVSATGLEQTGHDESGRSRIMVVEP